MNEKCVDTKNHNMCLNNTKSLYDEVLHTVDNNILSVKLAKNKHHIETVEEDVVESAPTIDVNCLNAYGKTTIIIENKKNPRTSSFCVGKTCRKSCPKVNVMHNQAPGPKKPEEEMLLLRKTREITPNDDMKYALEVEFKAPRNYIPLPQPGPPPPIIIPKESSIIEMNTPADKGKKKKKKKKK